MILQIFNDLKEKYPDEDSRCLSLVAIACFLIDKGCDWLATNKENRTAADEVQFCMRSIDVVEIFRRECFRYHSIAKLKYASNDQLDQLADNASHCMDQHGCSPSINSPEGTVELTFRRRSCFN